jgi:chromosome segregation ATPase
MPLFQFVPPRRFRFHLGLLCLLAGGILFCPLPASAQNVRGMMRRVQQMQQRERDAHIKQLQQQLTEVQKVVTESEPEVSNAASELQSARSQQTSAREQLEAKEKEQQEASKQLHETEQKVLAEQPADSDYGRAAAVLEEKQLALDAVVHQVLNLPPHEGPTTEAERATERIRLSADKKNQLKANSEYKRAEGAVSSAQGRLNEAKKLTLENNTEWKEAHAAKESLDHERKTLDSNLKSANAAVSKSQKQMNLVNARTTTARQRAMQIQSELSALGASASPQK